ncbi:unnamed protein product [Durusdinium trenchii]|uniref:Uncharacterized protein n=1 Tax=Durusdinium trenchii TaxID=1381693 RepID=A0ABP0P6B6_9DINO
MAAVLSVIGHVDESIEQRASLLAALKAKLDDGKRPQRQLVEDEQPSLLMLAEDSGEAEAQERVPPAPAAPAPPVIDVDEEDPTPTDGAGDPFSDVMAQLDRGLDARQQMIDALKAQLNKSVAGPKSKPAMSIQKAVSKPAAVSLHSSLLTGIPPSPPALANALAATGLPPGQPGLQPGMVPPILPSAPMTPATLCAVTPCAVAPMGSISPIAGEPPAKRIRREGVPLPLRALQAQDFTAKQAEQAALAARKTSCRARACQAQDDMSRQE